MPLKQGLGYADKKYWVLIMVGLFALLANCSLAQGMDSIYYFVPAAVKAKILEYKNREPASVYPIFGILSYYDDTTRVLIARYGDSPEELAFLIKNSNRFIRLTPTETVPILLRIDLIFSNLLHSVRNEGDPYAVYKHKLINTSGYSIKYVGLYDKARIVEAEYYQY